MSRYLIVKGKAGLGNRMLVMLTAAVYARLTRRQLVVDWSDEMYSSDGTNVFPRLFSSPSVESSCAIPDSDSVEPRVWYRHLKLCANELIKRYDARDLGRFTAVAKYSADLTVLEHEAEVLVMWGYLPQLGVIRRHLKRAKAPLARLSDAEFLRHLLKSELIPQPHIRQKINDFKRDRFGDRPVIGAHVRFSDNMRKRANAVHIPTYFESIDRILERYPDAGIFLATDNRRVADAFDDRYRYVLSTSKRYPPDGVAMHFDATRSDRCESAVEALVDIYLLASCDFLVYPRSSTFSHISAVLSALPADRIINVQRHDWMLCGKRLLQWWQLSGLPQIQMCLPNGLARA